MPKKVLVFELCSDLEQQLIRLRLEEDTLKRYQKVLKEFSVFGGEKIYHQSLGTKFLIEKFKADGGFSITDEHSRNEAYYFRCIRILAEYYNFGIIHTGAHLYGEIQNISGPAFITVQHNDAFIKNYYKLSPTGIEAKLCALRKYYRFLYLNQYIQIPLAERLPQANINGRMKFPTVWDHEMIEKIKASAERVSPAGKRSYAMIVLAAESGLRIGDIRDLKLTDIDWIQKKISIIQGKTKKAVALPLTEEAGWALIDYIKNGRPVTDSPNIFVKHRPPYDAFPVNSTLNHIFSSVLHKSDIPPEKRKTLDGIHSGASLMTC